MASDDGFTQVHVSGLPPDISDAEVEDALAQAIQSARPVPAESEEPRQPEVALDCRVVRHKENGTCKGYCFLSFLTRAEADEAVAALSAGAEVACSPIQAELSRRLKPAAKGKGEEDLHDMRIGRRNFQGVRKHPLSTSCSDKNVKLVHGRKVPDHFEIGGRGRPSQRLA